MRHACLPTIALTLALAGTACLAKPRCTRPTEFQPSLCPVDLPRVTAVHIEENGARSPAAGDDASDCARFRLTASHVRRYFARAWSTDPRDAHYTLDWSPCHATGSLTLADGRKAHWSINQFRTGTLSIEGGDSLFFYCRACRDKPFLQ